MYTRYFTTKQVQHHQYLRLWHSLMFRHWKKLIISGNSRKFTIFAPKVWISHPPIVISFLLVDSYRKNKIRTNVVHCAIWYHLYNFKNVKKKTWRSVTTRNAPHLPLFCSCDNGQLVKRGKRLEDGIFILLVRKY